MRSGIEKKYTDRELDLIEKLKEKYSYSQIGTIFGRSKNSVLGAVYRRRLKQGHQAVKDPKPKRRRHEKITKYYDTHQKSW
jgi:hypothetical protein|tara:strand:+ start:81 stop:323 length:243 start_codon:yes stop_codon:yes gene_type:complete